MQSFVGRGMRQSAVMWLVFLVAAMSMLSCNGLFYFPHKDPIYDPAEDGQKYFPISFVTEDGVRLAAWEFPAARASKGCVLHFHGNAENMTSHFLFASWLAERGYAVYTFDYRGYGASEGIAEREGTVRDGIAALRDIQRRCGKNPLIVFAQSLGGAIAIPAMVMSGVPVKILVVESSFASYRRIARQKLDSIWVTWPLQYPLSFLVSDALSPEDFAGRITCTTLFIHAEDDRVVPIEFGRELFAAIGTKDKDFWSIGKGGHTPSFAREESRYRDKLVLYLKEKLAQ